MAEAVLTLESHEDRWTATTIAPLAACGVGNFVSSTAMINCTFSAFLVPVTTTFGWERSQFSFVLTLISVIGIFAYPAAGRLMEKFGARPVVLTGNILFGLSIMALRWMPAHLGLVYLLFALVGLAAALPSTVLLARVASTWFHHKRGVALAFSTGLAIGAGGTFMSIFSQYLIDVVQWREAYFALGFLIIAIGFPVMFFFLREAPDYRSGSERTAPLPGIRFAEALRGADFWKLFVLVSMGAGALTALATHLTALLGDHGVSTSVAAGTLATISFTNAGWQIVLGHILDRSRSPWAAAPFIVLGIVGVLLIGASHQPSTVLFGGFLAGIGTGTEYCLLPFCMPRYFGFRSYGVVYGWIYGGTVLISGLTPYLMDLVYEAFGSYRIAVVLIGVALAVCAALVASLPRYRFGARVGSEAEA